MRRVQAKLETDQAFHHVRIVWKSKLRKVPIVYPELREILVRVPDLQKVVCNGLLDYDYGTLWRCRECTYSEHRSPGGHS